MIRFLFKKFNSYQLHSMGMSCLNYNQFFSIIHRPSHMQSMDRKYNGHAWCKVITTKIKNKFGLNFKKARCLGHLHCVQDDYQHFVCSTSHNETFQCIECTHILVVGQMVVFPFASLLECKLCHVLPLCVTNCSERIYYVVHRLQSISKVTIHLGVHKHLVVDGKCRVSMDKIRRLNTKEVDYTLNAKISVIFLSANKTFLAKHLLDDSGNGMVELLHSEQLEQIQDNFSELSLPNVCNLTTFFQHCLGGGYIDSSLELKSRSQYDYIHECCFPGQVLEQKVFIFKMLINGVGSGTNLVTQM